MWLWFPPVSDTSRLVGLRQPFEPSSSSSMSSWMGFTPIETVPGCIKGCMIRTTESLADHKLKNFPLMILQWYADLIRSAWVFWGSITKAPAHSWTSWRIEPALTNPRLYMYFNILMQCMATTDPRLKPMRVTAFPSHKFDFSKKIASKLPLSLA